jgi:hypothetical protein
MTSTFQAFSEAFDEMQRARRAWEAFGQARYDQLPPPGVWTTKRAYDEALKQYELIVAALVDPESTRSPTGTQWSTGAGDSSR